MPRKLEPQLARIEQLLREKLPAVARSLRPPATKRSLDRLRKYLGGTIPAELEAWFRWHDGQDPGAFQALIPESSWSALSAERVVGVHQFLNAPEADIKQPWKPEWLPLFENGGGDHLCLDRKTGAVITWYHDERSRPKEAKGLGALFDAIERGYKRMKKPAAIPPPPAKLRWTRSKVPSAAALDALPPGALFKFTAEYPMGRSVELRLKLGPDRWLETSGTTVAEAIAQWKELSASPPPESAGYYSDGANVRWAMTEYRKLLMVAVG